MKFLCILCLVLVCTVSFSAIDLMSIQANVYQNGLPLDSGNVSVFIYDAASGGNLIWNQTYNNIIVNGTYDILLGSNDTNNMTLTYGQFYYLELTINGVDQNFSGNNRQLFQSAVGTINSTRIATGAINTTHIANGNITTAKLDNGSVTATKIASGVINSTHLVSNLSLVWGNLTGFPAACSSGQFVSALGISPICGTPTSNVSNATGTLNATQGGTGFNNYSVGDIFYANSSTTLNKIMFGNNSVLISTNTPMWGFITTEHIWNGTITTSDLVSDLGLGFGNLSNYPAACDSGYFISALGDTPTCGTPAAPGAPNVSNVSGTLLVQNGGTGSNLSTLTTGSVLYADSPTTFTKLPLGTNNTFLMANSSSNAPVWANVTTALGVIGTSSGGTGFSSYSNGDILYINSSGVFTRLSISPFDKILLTSSSTPYWGWANSSHIADGTLNSSDLVSDLGLGFGNLSNYPAACTEGQFISQLGDVPTCGTPTSGAPNVSQATGTLNATQGGTGITSYTNGSLIMAMNSTSLVALQNGSSGQVLTIMSGFPSWQTPSSSSGTNVSNATGTLSVGSGGTGSNLSMMGLNNGGILYAWNASFLVPLMIGSNGQVLTVNGSSGYPSWTNVNVSNATGTLSIQNGGTGTNLSTLSTGDLLYANATTTFGKLSTNGNGKVLTVSGGTPSWGNITSGGVDINLWDSRGLRTNNLSTNDFDGSDYGYMIIGADSGTQCNTVCINHGLLCTANVYNVSGSSFGCGATGTGPKYCWCN